MSIESFATDSVGSVGDGTLVDSSEYSSVSSDFARVVSDFIFSSSSSFDSDYNPDDDHDCSTLSSSFGLASESKSDSESESEFESSDRCSEIVYLGNNRQIVNSYDPLSMINNGSGVYGHRNCKLEVRLSSIVGAGFGVFLRDGYRLYAGECITEYSGQLIRSKDISKLTTEKRRYTIHVDDVVIIGKRKLTDGDGFGSLINASHGVHRPPNVTALANADRVYIFAKLGVRIPYITGPCELFMAYGVSYWAWAHRAGIFNL